METNDSNQRICIKTIDDILTSEHGHLYYDPIMFNIDDSLIIVNNVKEILKNEPTVLLINTDDSELVIVGDLHGDIDILLRIFSSKGYPPHTRYLFLGDYVDRGRNSIEVIILLYAFKFLYPKHIFLIRGNHEFKDMSEGYGFKEECTKRILSYDEKMNRDKNMNSSYDQSKFNNIIEIFEKGVQIDKSSLFQNENEICRCKNIENRGEIFFNEITSTFKYLPLCSILNDSIFCVHGGISALIKNRDELLNLSKVGDQFSFNDSVQAELLWNDPHETNRLYERSPRGIGCLFNQGALELFLQSMNFSFVIRAHQMARNGYNWNFGKLGGILTVFSALDYCDMLNNAGIVVWKKCKDYDDTNDGYSIEVFENKNSKFFVNYPTELLLRQKVFCPLPDINLIQV